MITAESKPRQFLTPYRYRLKRRWVHGKGVLLYVMLNPSTADDDKDDPTIRKCVGFAKRLGFQGIEVVNLYAWRCTDPKGLKEAADPVGPDNDREIEDAFAWSTKVCAAWGGWLGPSAPDRAAMIVHASALTKKPLHALGTTAQGWPRHPLMLGYDGAALSSWRWPEEDG